MHLEADHKLNDCKNDNSEILKELRISQNANEESLDAIKTKIAENSALVLR